MSVTDFDSPKKPLSFLSSGRQEPEKIIELFLNRYTQSRLRQDLANWLLQTATSDTGISSGLLVFAQDLQKLFEALLLITKGHSSRRDFLSTPPDGRFKKEMLFLGTVYGQPVQALFNVFYRSMDDNLKHVWEQWSMICLENTSYIETNGDAGVIDHYIFLKEFQKLIEAFYILCAAFAAVTGTERLSLHQDYLHLKKREQENPYLVIRYFRETIPYTYACAEIWEITEGVVASLPETTLHPMSIIGDMEGFLCVVEAAYLIEEDPALLDGIKKLRNDL